MAINAGAAPVCVSRAKQFFQLYRHPFNKQLSEGTQKMCDGRLPRHRQRAREVRAARENFADHAAARIARADLDKSLHTGRVGGADHARKIHRAERLRFNRIGRRLLIGRVGTAPGATVELHIGRRCRLEMMQRAIGLAHRMRQLAMHRADTLQRKPMTTERRHHGFDFNAVAADHTLIRRVDDQHVDAFARANDSTHLIERTIHHAGDPLYRLLRRQLPALAQYFGRTRQIAREQR